MRIWPKAGIGVGSRVVTLFALLLVVLAIWNFEKITHSYVVFRDSLMANAGFGFVLPSAWLVICVGTLISGRSGIRKFWKLWITALLVSIVFWGSLNHFSGVLGITSDLGGKIGTRLGGFSISDGVLRMLGTCVVWICFIWPRSSFKASVGTFRIIGFCGRVLSRVIRNRKNLANVLLLARFPVWLYQRIAKKSPTRGSRAPLISVAEAPVPVLSGKPLAERNVTQRRILQKKQDRRADNEEAGSNMETLIDSYSESEIRISDEDLMRWHLPEVTILTLPPVVSQKPGINQERTAALIEDTLSSYGIEVSVDEIKTGPVVTMFGLVPGWIRRSKNVKERNVDGNVIIDDNGKQVVRRIEDKTRVKVDSIVAREKDLALALAAPSLRIEAPIPGASLVGIEVPNPRPAVVTLRSVMQTETFNNLCRKSKLVLGLGLGTGGEVAAADLANMPHLLIAGSTGSGKSVCINSVIASIIMQNSPWETRMLLIDPKRVELTPYNGIPHLITPVIVDVEKAVQVLKGMIQEMLRRYKIFEEAGVRNIEGYNATRSLKNRIPFLVVAVDELADLMMSSPTDIERSIIRLAQLGRATGIHLVVATQRPSVDVVTGLIKANFPSRISFAVASQVDSRTILDAVGAEKLLGKGDMLFQPPDIPKPKRIQGAFISDTEIEKLVAHWRNLQGPPPPEISLVVEETMLGKGLITREQGDELFDNALEVAAQYNRLSTSLLQRRLKIGYPRAARLMDLLEDQGVVGPGELGKSRDVIG